MEALHRMGRVGLGAQRTPHQVERVSVASPEGPIEVYRDGATEGCWPEQTMLRHFMRLPRSVTGAEIVMWGPLQWKQARRQAPPTVEDFVRTAINRVRWIARSQSVEIDRWWPAPHQIHGEWIRTRWMNQSRYSTRKQADVSLSGWVGTLQLDASAAPIQDLLRAAEIFGVGRNTSAGGGRFKIRWNPEKAR
jgi:hypothetical protein